MNKVFELLMKIKEKPELFLGKKSLVLLDTFLNGYIMCKNDYYIEETNIFLGFQEYIQQKYKIKTTQNWVKIIEFFSFTDENAFELFYKNFEEYILLHPENVK